MCCAARLLFAFWMACAVPALAAGEIEFDTRGGDAWTFERTISGRIVGTRCDRIELISPAGQVNAIGFDDRFVASVPLLSGSNDVFASCKKGRRTLISEAQQWHVRTADTPKAWIRLTVDGHIIRLDAGRSAEAPARPAPLIRHEWYGAPLGKITRAESIAIPAPSMDGEHYVHLRVVDALGRSDRSTSVFRVVDGKPEAMDLRFEHPAWVDRAIIYGATPYVFTPQTFDGIRARLEEIAQLGATVLWLSPVTEAAEDDFGYAVTDHFSLRRKFGDERAFRALVDEAHRLGLRVIVDFIPNHLSERHRYHLDAQEHGIRSAYHDWFERDAAGEITRYFDWSHLKNLDYDRPDVQSFMIEAFRRFVRDFGVDGFRVDASWAVASRAPEFWPRVRAELKRIDPDLFLLAEASAREPYHVRNGFDAAYDWTNQLGQWAWHDVFDEGHTKVERLRAALTNEGRGFPPDTLILRFLNNNDTGERFAARHGADLARLAATLLLTLPGVPLIYNGDEMAAQFEPYDEGPPLEWDDAHPLREHYRALCTLRERHSALRSRDLDLLVTKQDENLLAYRRPGASADEDILVLLNFSERTLEATPADVRTGHTFERYANARDLLTGEQISALRIEPKSALVLALPHF